MHDKPVLLMSSTKHLRSNATSISFCLIVSECRGIGGLFFDDYDNGGFEESFQFVAEVGKNFLIGLFVNC